MTRCQTKFVFAETPSTFCIFTFEAPRSEIKIEVFPIEREAGRARAPAGPPGRPSRPAVIIPRAAALRRPPYRDTAGLPLASASRARAPGPAGPPRPPAVVPRAQAPTGLILALASSRRRPRARVPPPKTRRCSVLDFLSEKNKVQPYREL
jgi:hypothetical protein